MKRLAILAALAIAAAGCRGADVGLPALRAELVRLGAEDQAAREGFGQAAARNDTAYLLRLLAGDSARTARLREIVAEFGWPTPALVGRDGAGAAWLILQHTPDTAFRRRLLPRLDSAAARGELPRGDLAMLTDRILVSAGQPQRYGSSFAILGERMVMHPVDDVDSLDARRAAVGLPPMAEYARLLEEMYKLPVDWPPGSTIGRPPRRP